MKQFLKKNWALAIVCAGSILLITMLIITNLTPESITNPEYDFVYIESDSVYFGNQIDADTYIVENQKIVAVPGKRHSAQFLWLYDSTDQKSRRMSLKEVEKLTIDSSEVSPDGFTVSIERSKEPVTWGDGYYDYPQFLVFKKGSQVVPIQITRSRYESFVGWVVE